MKRDLRGWVRTTGLSIVLMAIPACYDGGSLEPIACTDQFVYGLNVTVRDQSTSAAIADDATLTIREGSYEEVVTESWDGLTLSGAGERPGTYTVTIEHVGYAAWTRSGVVITADECHVIPVSLTAELTPIP